MKLEDAFRSRPDDTLLHKLHPQLFINTGFALKALSCVSCNFVDRFARDT
jgi:hypothetical protein